MCVAVGTVLRFWSLGTGPLTADETYSAVAAHLPFAQIWGHIAATDRHPPFSYYLLSPVAHVTTSTFALRAPAALSATLALAVFAWWQRRYGLAGLVATALFAVSPFVLVYDRQARMFALLTLGAVVAAAASDRWLATFETRWAVAAAAGGLLAALSYSVGFLLPGFLLLVPGWRWDRRAWIFRLTSAGAIGIWAVLWLGNSLKWAGAPSGYPSLTPSWVAGMINGMVAPVPADEWLVLVLLAAGLVVTLRQGGRPRQLVLTLVVVPVLVMIVLSARSELFIPKTLLMVAWAAPVLLGNLVVAAWNLRPLAAGAVVALLVLVVVPYIGPSLTIDEGEGPMLAAVARARRPGDAVAIDPGYLGHLLDWYEGIVPGVPLRPDGQTMPGAVIFHPESGAQTGRIWLVRSPSRAPAPSPGAGHWCGPELDVGGGYTLRCLQSGPGR